MKCFDGLREWETLGKSASRRNGGGSGNEARGPIRRGEDHPEKGSLRFRMMRGPKQASARDDTSEDTPRAGTRQGPVGIAENLSPPSTVIYHPPDPRIFI